MTNDEVLALLETTASLGPITHLPRWDAFQAERVVPAASALLDAAEAELTRLETEAPATWEGVMVPLERLQLRLGALLGGVSHLLSVKYSDALQQAYDSVRPRYVAFSSRMAQSRALFDAMCAIRDSQAFQGFEPARQRLLTESIRDMERSGVHLDGEAKARYEEIQQRLSTLRNDFQTNLVKEEKGARVVVTSSEEVAGVPVPILAAAAKTAVQDGIAGATAEQGPWHFVVNGVNYTAVIQSARDRKLRERFYRAFRQRGTSEGLDNRPILEEMLRLRQEEARLVGFDHYAALSVDAKMASSVEEVWGLLDELEKAARPVAEVERRELEHYLVDHGLGDRLEPWDVTFVSERLREERYDYDTEALRAYFQMPRVVEGLFSLTQRLYALEIHEAAPGSVPVWDASVSFYEVKRGGQVIAGFFVDPYARPGEKRGGAWMNTVV
ncbi:MAG TPA: M3 family metallopeptidase, partial [Pseudomonadales bacterium]